MNNNKRNLNINLTKMNSKKRKLNVLLEPRDRINELPEEILVDIISRLTIKQAVATSLISTQWKHLWKFHSGRLCFDDHEAILDDDDYDGNYIQTETEKTKFVDCVNHVLRSYQGVSIKELEINVDLQGLSHNVIDEWIQIALEKNVQSIMLEFRLDFRLVYPPTSYVFLMKSHCGFGSLKKLFFKAASISGDALQSILDNCSNLEELKLLFCSSLQVLNLSSLSLKRLNLWLCEYDPTDIKIYAPNLLSFTWTPSTTSKLVLESVPKLRHVHLCGFWHHIRNHHSQLQELVLECVKFSRNSGKGEENEGNNDIPELSKLTRLTIKYMYLNDQTFCDFVAFLRAAPSLEDFTLELLFSDDNDIKISEETWTKFKAKNHCFKNLKKVKIAGFGGVNDVEFIRNLFNCAPLLDKIIIDACHPFYLGAPIEYVGRQTTRYFEARSLAVEFSKSLACDVIVV
ncbi:hypothetical protein ACFE04_023772 [Oxalis oulophora]